MLALYQITFMGDAFVYAARSSSANWTVILLPCNSTLMPNAADKSCVLILIKTEREK